MNIENKIVALGKDIEWIRENTKLQATEYERRLSDLNHAHERSLSLADTYVTQEKYEDYVKASFDRYHAAQRSIDARIELVDGRIDTFRADYEVRHQEVTLELARQRGAAEASKQVAQRGMQRLTVAVGSFGAILTLVAVILSHHI